MWSRSFIATTVAIGDTVDEALAAIGAPDVAGDELVAALRSPRRADRAAALGSAVSDIGRALQDTALK